MALDQHASNLIDLTIKAFNGDATSVSPTDGISLIDSWISFLKTDNQSTDSVSNGLSDLKAELQSGSPDGTAVQRILSDLTEQTKQITTSAAAGNESELNGLTKALQQFSQQLINPSKPANTGGQAPMTSTVGGESTNSGTGASALNTEDNDLSDRNGGTTDGESTGDMDDTTGSNGGSSKEPSPNESGDSGYSSQPSRSRSDSARVDGSGISGGTGDSDTAQSGGRSQY